MSAEGVIESGQPARPECPACGEPHPGDSCPGAEPALLPRWLLRVLLAGSLVVALGMGWAVRSVFTGAFVESPPAGTSEGASASVAPWGASPAVPAPAAGSTDASTSDAQEETSASGQSRRLSPRRTGEPDLVVPARLSVRAEEVRRARRRYRDLEREIRSLGGLESAAAVEKIAEMEQVARDLRRLEADLDRARRPGG